MIEIMAQGNDWRSWMEQFEPEKQSGVSTNLPAHLHESQRETWDQTDRLFQFPARLRSSALVWDGSHPRAGDNRAARARWLREHDVHTQFLDAGIGCCWFAQQGDDEPVCGETEDAAIARLARENGLPWGEVMEARNAG